MIGEHTDYCQGFVFPMAIDLVTIVAGAPNGTDNEVNLISGNVECEDDKKTSFKTDDVEKLSEGNKWSNYRRSLPYDFSSQN